MPSLISIVIIHALLRIIPILLARLCLPFLRLKLEAIALLIVLDLSNGIDTINQDIKISLYYYLQLKIILL
jgi:hypothetical protein